NVEVAGAALTPPQAPSAQAKLLPALAAWGNDQLHLFVECLHRYSAAEHCLPWRHRQFHHQVVGSLDGDPKMRQQLDVHVQVAGRTAIGAGLSLSCQAEDAAVP